MRKSKQGTTAYVILGLLTIRPLSGYGAKKIIDRSVAHFWSESNGQLYPTLKQLLEKGWIAPAETSGNDKRKQQCYHITPAGRSALSTWMTHQDEKHLHRDEHLLKLFFGANLPKRDNIRRLKGKAKKIQQNLKEYQRTAKQLQEQPHPHLTHWLIALNKGICLAEAELKWCQESIHLLQKEAT